MGKYRQDDAWRLQNAHQLINASARVQPVRLQVVHGMSHPVDETIKQ
jgi:hypothetical protein